MVVKGNTKRFVIGLWVLAALLILWYNGSAMTSLLDQPLTGLSPEARETITKWQRLEMRVAERLKDIVNPQEMEKIMAAIDFKKIKAILPIKKDAPIPVPVKKSQKVVKKEVVLPSLSGILAIHDAEGKTQHLAVVDGKAQEVESVVNGFFIKRIDANGVLLTQEGETWFVSAPKVEFTVDNSNITQSSGSE